MKPLSAHSADMVRSLFATFVLSVSNLGAASIFVSNTSPPLPVVGNNFLPVEGAEGFVLVGSFDSGFDLEMAIGAFDFAAVDAAFNQFGETLVLGAPGGNPPQGFFREDVSSPISELSPLVGQNIYLILGAGSHISDATGLAVARDAQTFDFDAPVFEALVSLAEMTLVFGQIVDVTIDFGGPMYEGDAVCVGGPFCIPEPSSGILAALAAGVCLARRHRRQVTT